MDMQEVESSAIVKKGYDAATEVLRLEWSHGKVYDYMEVPQTVHDAMMAANSIGKFVNAEIKPNYKAVEVK